MALPAFPDALCGWEQRNFGARATHGRDAERLPKPLWRMQKRVWGRKVPCDTAWCTDTVRCTAQCSHSRTGGNDHVNDWVRNGELRRAS